jgi:hypothetical protein
MIVFESITIKALIKIIQIKCLTPNTVQLETTEKNYKQKILQAGYLTTTKSANFSLKNLNFYTEKNNEDTVFNVIKKDE